MKFTKKQAKKIIVEYLHKKHDAIYNETNIEFMNKKDFKYIEKKWDEEKCFNILNTMLIRIKYLAIDSVYCPYCIEKSLYCSNNRCCKKCNYKKNHGLCSFSTSTYSKIKDTLNVKEEILEVIDFYKILETAIEEITKGEDK